MNQQNPNTPQNIKFNPAETECSQQEANHNQIFLDREDIHCCITLHELWASGFLMDMEWKQTHLSLQPRRQVPLPVSNDLIYNNI